jgi:phosphatidylserine decarboxylase
MRKEYMGEFTVSAVDWFGGHGVRLWNDNLPVQTFGLISSRRRQKVSGSVSLQIGFLPPPGSDAQDALKKATSIYDSILSRAFITGENMSVLGVPAHEGIGTVMVSRDGEETTQKSRFRVLGSAMTNPFSGEKDADKNHLVFDECDLSDDGLSSSDDEMEDALEGDEDGYLRESPGPMDHNPLDDAGEYLSTSPSAVDVGSRRSSGGSTPITASAPTSSRRRRIFRRKGRKGKTFHLSQGQGKGVQGIVVMEVSNATDLPKLKNALRVGWDMDPFVVISFGKKVFRTRVIRHSLNPTWDEKLLFHVHEHETSFTVQMAVLDWDKVSGNDMVGHCTLPLAELMALAPKPDPETGLYAEGEDGKHESKEFTLPIVTAKDKSWEARHSPTLTVRAKYEPYDALRQRFWRQYTLQYDSDDTGTMSFVELTTMLDSLGSTLTTQTLESFFTRYGKNPDNGDELTVDEVVRALEEEVTKSPDQKRKVTSMTDVDTNELNERLLAGWPKPQTTTDSSNASTISVRDESKASTLPPTDAPSPSSSDAEDSSEPQSDDQFERVINIRECPLCRRPRLGKRSEKDIITHLAVCASADWNRVDRIMAASYVTSSQAQRKMLTKLVNKVAVGRYSLGANSANTIVQDRLTGQLQEEKMAVYVRIGIRVLYKGAGSQMARARAKKLLKSLSVKQGIKYDSPASAADIPGFIAFHHLNVNEIADPLDSFKTFNEFFYRKLRPDARPLDEPDNPGRLVSMADCRMMAFNTVNQASQIWIKGRDFTVSRLLGPRYASVAHKYDGGGLAIFRLAPQDYHRFHSPVRGRIGKITHIDGEYYTVNPQAIRSSLDVYGENVRQIVPIESEEFGTVMTVWVGAMMVGSIGTTVKEGEMVERGQELGWFAFGGSTIVALFENGRVSWDQDLQDNAAAAIETLVRVGMGIGRAE